MSLNKPLKCKDAGNSRKPGRRFQSLGATTPKAWSCLGSTKEPWLGDMRERLLQRVEMRWKVQVGGHVTILLCSCDVSAGCFFILSFQRKKINILHRYFGRNISKKIKLHFIWWSPPNDQKTITNRVFCFLLKVAWLRWIEKLSQFDTSQMGNAMQTLSTPFSVFLNG